MHDLFVFAGQSNMMGACAYPPKHPIQTEHSFEYKYEIRRRGNSRTGKFLPAAHPAGEYAYRDLSVAFSPDMTDENGKSKLSNYAETTYFCPAEYNVKDDETKSEYRFAEFSEHWYQPGVSLPPVFAVEWEKKGHACLYTHIAKGSVSITHYFDDAMAAEYTDKMTAFNLKNGTHFPTSLSLGDMEKGAAGYFKEKTLGFFEDAAISFPDLGHKCFVWLQGENDSKMAKEQYKLCLSVLWHRLQELGFEYFFCIRVGFWYDADIVNVIKAQEEFCAETDGVYMVTRAASLFEFPDHLPEDWFSSPVPEEYKNCRDGCYGFKNNHFNEHGFETMAPAIVQNIDRILYQNLPPLLEKENITALL